MSDVEINNAPVDDFDFFVEMMNQDTKGLSQTTRDALAAEKESNSKQESHEVYVDAPDDTEEYETQDWSFLDENNPVFEDEEEDESTSEEEEVDTPFEDEEAPEEDNVDYGDAVDIDLDTIITIHGKEYTAEELVNRYQEDEVFNQQKAAFEAEREAFLQDKEASANLIELNMLECDKQLAEYKYFNWDWYAENDPQGYVENQRFLSRIEHKKQELMNEQNRLLSEKQQREDEAFRAKSRSCVQVLESEIPGWNEDLYSNLLQHAQDYYGANEEDALKWNNPSIFKMLYDAYRAHNDILKAKASIKRTKVNGKYVRPGMNATHQTNEQAKRDAIAKGYMQGKVSQEQAFAFLED